MTPKNLTLRCQWYRWALLISLVNTMESIWKQQKTLKTIFQATKHENICFFRGLESRKDSSKIKLHCSFDMPIQPEQWANLRVLSETILWVEFSAKALYSVLQPYLYLEEGWVRDNAESKSLKFAKVFRCKSGDYRWDWIIQEANIWTYLSIIVQYTLPNNILKPHMKNELVIAGADLRMSHLVCSPILYILSTETRQARFFCGESD